MPRKRTNCCIVVPCRRRRGPSAGPGKPGVGAFGADFEDMDIVDNDDPLAAQLGMVNIKTHGGGRGRGRGGKGKGRGRGRRRRKPRKGALNIVSDIRKKGRPVPVVRALIIVHMYVSMVSIVLCFLDFGIRCRKRLRMPSLLVGLHFGWKGGEEVRSCPLVVRLAAPRRSSQGAGPCQPHVCLRQV